jgi:hypothetical protein
MHMHTTHIRWLVFMLLALALPASAADVVFPTGSRIGLVPPPGLTMSTSFVGFEDPSNNVAIAIVALPPEAFAGLDQSADGDALKRQGLTSATREPFTLAAGKAFLVIGSQDVQNVKLRKWIMVVSTPELTALVTLQVPDDARSAYPDDTVRAALASLAVRPLVPIEEQLSLVPFKVGDLAGFRIGGIIGGRAVMLTDAAAEVVGPTHDPQIIVAVAPGGPAQAADRENFARDTFGGIPNLKDIHVVSAEPLRIGGLPGHQIMAQAKENATGADVTIVQWLRFGTGGYMHLVAVARTDVWVQAYTRFRQVRDGIELR